MGFKRSLVRIPAANCFYLCKEWKGWEGCEDFNERMGIVRIMLFKTIENRLTAGLGPFD
jgi:hypothetical protein